MKSVDEKFKTVIDKNTFYFFNHTFEEKYEGYLISIKQTLLNLKYKIDTEGLKKDHLEELLSEKENGLVALLALTGFSYEQLKRLITVVRVVDDPELTKLIFKKEWYNQEPINKIREWPNGAIEKLIISNKHFKKGIVNLFFEGATVPFLANTIPLFELKKLSISKLKFEIDEIIDTLVRYRTKGSYSAQGENNSETLIKSILDELGVSFEKGDLSELIDNAPDNKRTMDFIIPNKENPKIIIESSYMVTTSSSQGDKSKTEISIDSLIKKHYPEAKFIGFVDGIGWYVRQGDLKRMVSAYEDVFTFHKEELFRFRDLLVKTFGGR